MATVTSAPDAVVLKHEVLRATPRLMRTEILRHAWRRAGWPEASMSAVRWRRLAVLDQRAQASSGARSAPRVEISSDGLFVVAEKVDACPKMRRFCREVGRRDSTGLTRGRTDVPWAGLQHRRRRPRTIPTKPA